MNNIDDKKKRLFEAEFLKEFAGKTRLPQSVTLEVARENIEFILAGYNDGYAPKVITEYLIKCLDLNKIRDERVGPARSFLLK